LKLSLVVGWYPFLRYSVVHELLTLKTFCSDTLCTSERHDLCESSASTIYYNYLSKIAYRLKLELAKLK